MNAIVETLLNLLRIQSVTGEEAALCSWVQQSITQRFQLENEWPSIERYNNSLVIYGPVQADRETLCFAGHLDTVPGSDVGDRVRIEGEKIIGTGASDMKAGLAVMLELLNPQLLAKSHYNLQFIFYHSEEGPLVKNGIHEVLKNASELKHATMAFLLEPTNNTLHLGCLGLLNASVTFRGRRAHSARPWEGENALHKAGPLLSRLGSLTPKEVQAEGHSYFEVISATLASAGEASNIVPESCTLNLNMRISPGMSLSDAHDRLRNIVAGEAEVQIIDEAPAGKIPADNRVLKRLREMFKLEEYPKQAYTDVAMFNEHGIAAVNCGPGLSEQAHQRGEYVPIPNLLQSLQMYRHFLLHA